MQTRRMNGKTKYFYRGQWVTRQQVADSRVTFHTFYIPTKRGVRKIDTYDCNGTETPKTSLLVYDPYPYVYIKNRDIHANHIEKTVGVMIAETCEKFHMRIDEFADYASIFAGFFGTRITELDIKNYLIGDCQPKCDKKEAIYMALRKLEMVEDETEGCGYSRKESILVAGNTRTYYNRTQKAA